jgi:glycosyltransferase involved in cell wall biosynthesis
MDAVAPILTIAIPTYNRNAKLNRSLAILLPQLNDSVKLVILDNGSSVSVADTIDAQVASHKSIRVLRNRQNLGVAANIIKCFEACDTEWMWLLGDDDVPNSDAVAQVLSDLADNSDCVFLNYKSPICAQRSQPFYTVGQEDMINKLDNFGNLLFMSVGIYNLNKLAGDLRLTYQLSYCICPHMVYLISGIGEHGKVGFLTKELHNLTLWDTTEAENWSWLSLSLYIPIMYEIPLNISAEAKKKFSKHLLTHISSSKQIFAILEQPKYKNIPIYQKRFLLRQTYFRSLLFSGFDKRIIPFAFYDLKLRIQDFFAKSKTYAHIELDDRV